jgi:hypothetical protein
MTLRMYWREALLLAVSCAPVIGADNPFIGDWKENCAKGVSTFPGCGQQTVHIEAMPGGSVKISDEFTNAAGKRQDSTGIHALDGSEVRPTGTQPDFVQSIRRISPNVWERIAKREGDIRRGYWAVSSDGKLLVITGFGNSQGREYYFHRILERQ